MLYVVKNVFVFINDCFNKLIRLGITDFVCSSNDRRTSVQIEVKPELQDLKNTGGVVPFIQRDFSKAVMEVSPQSEQRFIGVSFKKRRNLAIIHK